MIQVAPLVGYKSVRALNAFSALLLGLKMMPAYLSTSFEKFYEAFDQLSLAEKEKMIREAALFVELAEDEVEAIASFAKDANGIAYTAINLNSLSAGQIHEIIVAVCMEIGRIKIGLVSAAEKKNCEPSQSMSEASI